MLYILSIYGQNINTRSLEEKLSLDQTDIDWLKNNPESIAEIQSFMVADTSAFSRYSAEVIIKLESNKLQGLSNEEARKHEEKITEIIHGAMKRYGLEEQMVLSALSWYNIFQANDPER